MARRWRKRLGRILQPPRSLRPTQAGWCFFALILGVGFAALNTGNNLLYLVLSLMLAFLVLSGVFSESALRGIQVARRLPREVFAGAGNTVGLRIHNAQRRVPAFAIVVEDLIRNPSGAVVPGGRVFSLRVGPGESDIRSYQLTPARRGVLRFVGYRVSTRFPFGLFSKSLLIDGRERLLVYPKIEPIRVPDQFGGARDAGEHVAGAAGTGSVAAGLREFTPGDSFRRIHWRASQRRRTLLVRDVESEHESEVEVRLRTRGLAADAAFEKGVSWAASEAVAHLEAGSRVGLSTDTEAIAPDRGARHRAHLLTFLARVEPGDAVAVRAA